MTQTSINQRIKFLLEKYNLSVRAFSELIEQKPANTQNYVGARGSMPGADYLQSITEHFEEVNPVWLLTGKGEPFKDDGSAPHTQTSISGKKNEVNIAGGKAIQNNYSIADCEKELEIAWRDAASYQREIELLRGQLEGKDALIAAKEEMLVLLRGGHNRPN